MTTPNVPPGSDDQPTATTSVTSVRVIEALKDRHTAGITQLASELELSKGTVHKHLNTLRQLDYVVKDGHEYRLSVSSLDWERVHEPSSPSTTLRYIHWKILPQQRAKRRVS